MANAFSGKTIKQTKQENQIYAFYFTTTFPKFTVLSFINLIV